MIELVRSIPKVNYSKNFPDIFINSDSDKLLFFLAKQGEAPLISEDYDMPPGDEPLRIALSDLLHRELKYNLPDFGQVVTAHPDVLQLYELTCQENESSPVFTLGSSIAVIKGFAYKSPDINIEDFLFQTILSLRPEISYIYDFEPVCLSFYQPVASIVKVDIRFKDETTTSLNYATINPLIVQSVNVSYGNLQQLVSKEIHSYDVYITVSNVQKTNKIRFVLNDFEFQRESFVYANRLGGWDSISFLGNNEETTRVESSLAYFRNKISQYDAKLSRIKTKNIGNIPSEEFRLQVLDFLSSEEKYVIENGQLLPVVTNQIETSTSRGDMNSISFEYQFSHDLDQYSATDLPKKYITID